MAARKFLSRRARFKILTIFLSLLIGLTAFEIFLRLINYRPAIVDPALYISNNSEILPFKLKPNYDGYYLGQRVVVDADGYRIVSPAPALVQSAGNAGARKTVVVLGDSLVFGYGLSNEDTIGSQLQNLIFKNHLNYQVRNIGSPAYTSWNEYGALSDYLAKYPADQILLTYNVNDITFDNDYFGISQGRQAEFSDSTAHRFTKFLYSHLYTTFLISDTIKKIRARFSGGMKTASPSDLAEMNNQPALDYSMQALAKIQELCRARNIKLAVGIYRDTAVYSRSPQKTLEFEALIARHLDERGIHWFVIKSHAEKLPLDEATVFWNDPHPSPKAVAFIVEDMIKELE